MQYEYSTLTRQEKNNRRFLSSNPLKFLKDLFPLQRDVFCFVFNSAYLKWQSHETFISPISLRGAQHRFLKKCEKNISWHCQFLLFEKTLSYIPCRFVINFAKSCELSSTFHRNDEKFMTFTLHSYIHTVCTYMYFEDLRVWTMLIDWLVGGDQWRLLLGGGGGG